MKAISYIDGMDHGFQNPLVDIEKAMPSLKDRDLLVRIKAISVNPVDTKVRRNSVVASNMRILG